MCRREGHLFARGVGGREEGGDDDYGDCEEDWEDGELMSLLAEREKASSSCSSFSSNPPSSSSSSSSFSDGASIRVPGEDGAAASTPIAYCDCGPVVVRDAAVASGAIPVCDRDRGGDGNPTTTGERFRHHPLWKRRFLATDDMRRVYAFYVNDLLGIASASPPDPPRRCAGGILADEMGLGKTVMLLSLILKTKEGRISADGGQAASGAATAPGSRRAAALGPPEAFEGGIVDLSLGVEDDSDYISMNDDDEAWTGERAGTAREKPVLERAAKSSNGTTLVVAPLSLIAQWEEELASKTDLSHLVYYDSTKKATGGSAFACVDVVVTTYGSIQSEFVSWSRAGSVEPGQCHPLLKFCWGRIILDEAHGIKNPRTVVSKACCMLTAKSRWCVTGTPIQNSLSDVYGLLKFLRHEPWCEPAFWRSSIADAISSGVSTFARSSSRIVNEKGGMNESSPRELAAGASAAFGRVRRVLAPIMLRRTKNTLAEDGTPILTLPPIDFSIVHVTLSPPERQFYNSRK
jgi:DNA repair protein RAD5